MACPNINLDSWKNLVAARGEDMAYYLWDKYDGTVPQEEYEVEVSLQVEGMPMSKASKEILEKVKEVAGKMGVSIQSLVDYAKSNPAVDTKSINGIADLVKGVVAISTGREDVALTEEMVHIATAILEQTNPSAVTAMIAKIDRFKIYKKVLDAYKNRKDYQLSDGKPNIRKIKKEAVDKLIAELIINDNQGDTEFPELLEEENRSLIKKWWQMITDFIRGMYTSSNIDIFKNTATAIIDNTIGGTVKDIRQEDVFFQITPNSLVDKLYNTILDIDRRMKLVPKTATDKRHYTIDGNRITKTVTEKVEEQKTLPDMSELQKALAEQKKEWGSEGHSFIEQYITSALIDENGYKRPNKLNVSISSNLDGKIQQAIKTFAEDLINSYPEGTRFLLEKKAVNEKEKGMLASTIDFIAIIPSTKKDGTEDVKVDVLDWKFISLDKEKFDDVPWYSQEDWKLQMGEYSKMLYNYGLKTNQLRRARMIPFVVNYNYMVPGDPKSGLVPNSLEIGKVDSLKETNIYLLPVPINSESSGVPEIDRLVASLQAYYDKLYIKSVSNEEWADKKEDLNELSSAIRQLRIKLDFAPITKVATSFLNSAAKTFKEFEKLDFSKLSLSEIESKAGILLNYQKSAEKFSDLDKVFLSKFESRDISAADRDVLHKLEQISASTDRMLGEIIKIQRELAVQIALKEGITTEAAEAEPETSILAAEKDISAFERSFLEESKLSSRIVNLASNLITTARNQVRIEFSRMMHNFSELLLNLDKEAASAGKTPFEMIGTVGNGNINLIKKLDKTFLRNLWEAKQNGNKKFILENIDINKYRELAKQEIEKQIAALEEKSFSEDPDEDVRQRNIRIVKIKNSLDIDSGSFNGFKDFKFGRILKQSIVEEKHLSKEYKEMSKYPSAVKMWEFFTSLNERATKMGYLKKKGSSFFPLIEATMLQRLSKTNNITSETFDFFKEMYTVKEQEGFDFAKTDPETQQVKKEIPRYFTRTDRAVEQLSTDLNKVGALWINSILNYQASKDLENILLTLYHVEKAKGKIITDQNQNILFESGAPKIDESAAGAGTDILQTMIDDYIYGIRERLSSIGNVGISKLTGAISKTEEEKEKRTLSTKKVIENSNKLLQSLALGLKPVVAIPNYLGFNFQAFINAGGFYRFREFKKRDIQVTTGIGLSTIDKGLLDLIVPLNEEITLEKRRELAKKQGYLQYLNTWTFQDVMMSTMSFPERKLQLANGLAFNDNSMVVDGKIVNIRQYLKQQDRQTKYKMSQSERRALEATFEDRVKELKETRSLSKIAKIEDGLVVIPGVSDRELAKYRTKVIEYSRNLNGQMSNDNKADYRRDTILKSFMMFKGWIPKQIGVRILDIRRNAELNDWEYGRTRAFMKTWIQTCNWNLFKMREIIAGTDQGLALLSDMLERKKQEYYTKTGKTLDITEEEFYDMMRRELSNQAKELGLLFSILGVLIAAKLAAPDDDDDDLTKNRYNYFLKLVNKTSDELAFYYNPASFEGITRGSIMPAVGLLARVGKAGYHITEETVGRISDDEDMQDKAHPIKYFLDIIPGPSQFNKEVLPLIDPELAKELGIRVTPESRRQ